MKHTLTFITVAVLLLIVVGGCGTSPVQVKRATDTLTIYPDYTDIAIPYNIAPLNFLVRNADVQQMEVTVRGTGDSLTVKGDREVRFPPRKWKRLLDAAKGSRLKVTVALKINGEWFSYPPFHWDIISQPIDRYLSYRAIEPGYEVWNALQLRERDLETFDERVLADNNLIEGSCMNCHTYDGKRKEHSFFHLRGAKGGTVLNVDGKLRKLRLKTDGMVAAAVYGELHPSGRYGVFSTNIIIPGFHAADSKRLEVYDTKSDLLLADLVNNRILSSPVVADTLQLETFPVFSAEGDRVYFCTAPMVALPDSIHQLKYSLCSIAFDAATGTWGNKVDTLWNARLTGRSVCHPKVSPDGKYLLYTVADFGTFPIWHRETDLQLMNLQTGETNVLAAVNSDLSDTYHSWSSDGGWFVFASKRGDGMYGKPYFAYINPNGQAGKAFVLPQEDPAFYDFTLKSFNIPELSQKSYPFSATDIEKLYFETEAERFE
ncbi:MAG: hypothetical protein LBM62_01955 [Mediterranea sp.]|jgi:hypothetical protein|nr:hypothetical protein [Mediterranea sp.]